ncbi:glycosyltransferase family 1 protein [Pengzhenrongella frigida]|uniref:Glycosyltransferase family 1 protein n=2 Tax=Pengzhenrongella frigida TaxID=1259133 RepID=A0A4Q5MYN6_9MICO|nr:glycosyltransferase family 1 protein [Cellulomonas sp. HLT2-17]
MGQQVYEEEVAARAPAALGPGITVHRTVARSLRSPLAGTVRLPHWVLREAPSGARRAVGAVMYPGADVVHRMGLSLPPARVPEIVTVHDTVAWRFPDESAPEPFAAQETRRAAAVVSVSQFAADDVAERLGLDHVHVVHNGVDGRFFDAPPLSSAQLEGLGVTGPYVLHAGGSSIRKNLDGLAAAWPLVRSSYPGISLVLSGPPSERRNTLFGALAGTVLVGRVPAAMVPGLIAGARAVVVPSLYEGFGLPALEAMACRVPVVAADRSSLPEVCGDAGILVEPDGPALADGLVHALRRDGDVEERVARGRARAAGFTWEASAAGHAAIWREVLDRI